MRTRPAAVTESGSERPVPEVSCGAANTSWPATNDLAASHSPTSLLQLSCSSMLMEAAGRLGAAMLPRSNSCWPGSGCLVLAVAESAPRASVCSKPDSIGSRAWRHTNGSVSSAASTQLAVTAKPATSALLLPALPVLLSCWLRRSSRTGRASQAAERETVQDRPRHASIHGCRPACANALLMCCMPAKPSCMTGTRHRCPAGWAVKKQGCSLRSPCSSWST